MRLEKHFSNNSSSTFNIIPPDCKNDNSIYANWIKKHGLKSFERLVIISSLAYIYTPNVFDKFLIKNKGLDKRFTEFGGKIDDKNSRFIPTLETLTFLHFGNEVAAKFNTQIIFNENHLFNKKGIMSFSEIEDLNTIFETLAKPNHYEEILPYVKENYQKVQEYNIYEDWIYNNIYKKILKI